MKQKISVTIDEISLKKVEKMLVGNRFRNRSHVLEFCLEKYLESGGMID